MGEIIRGRNIGGTGIGGGGAFIDYVFADRAARDTFFASNLNALLSGETIILIEDDGSGVTVVEIWTGETNPATYDNALWKDITTEILSASDIKILYESNANTNAFTDDEQTKVGNLAEDYISSKHIVSTTNTTQTVIASIPISSGDTISIDVNIVGRRTVGEVFAKYVLSALFYRRAGDVAQQGTTVALAIIESDITWDANIIANTTSQTIDVVVTGSAATIRWQAIVSYHNVI